MDDSTPDSRLPNEILDQIFELLAESFVTLATPLKEAQAARGTLRCCTVVSHRWHDLVARFLERCVTLPWTASQLESYTSRARHPATTVRIVKVPNGNDGGSRLIEALGSFTGVKRLHLPFQNNTRLPLSCLPDVLRSPCLDGLIELRIVGGMGRRWDDTTPTPYRFRLERLSIPSVQRLPSRLLELLIPPTADPSLIFLEVTSQDDGGDPSVSLPVKAVTNIRHLIVTPDKRGNNLNSLSLPFFHSLTSLELKSSSAMHPAYWSITWDIVDQITKLSHSATLTRLALPSGSITYLTHLRSYFFTNTVFSHLEVLSLPNLSRAVVESKEPGRAFLKACEGRGIEVLLQEDLGFDEDLSRRLSNYSMN
ncbi:hypothetical protein RQP46_001542 [Phenoliferia psychrophenolica]